jgi:hypothetical protein
LPGRTVANRNLLAERFSRRLPPVSLPFSTVYLAWTGPKPLANQSLGSFAVYFTV